MARIQNAGMTSTRQEIQQIVNNMVSAGKAIIAEPPVWVATKTFATLKREQGTIINDGRGIIFRDLSGDLQDLNGVTLNLKGKGPLVKVCHVKAVRDMSGTYNGRDWSIKKGDEGMRCFS